MRRVSEKRAEWLEQYKKILYSYVPTACARCCKRGNNWTIFNGDFEPHHPYRRTTREFCCVVLPLCHDCHEWIHHNTVQAKADGWLVSPKGTFLNV